jgi:hypothetical protein
MSAKKKLRIVSDGTAIGTHIYAGDQELMGVVRIDFDPLEAGGMLTVRLTAYAEIDVTAQDADEEFASPTVQ